MEAWKVVLDEAAFQSFVSSRASDRRKLLGAFERLRSDPQRRPDYFAKDATGRVLSVWADRPFLITYRLDAFVSEIRIMNLQKIRY